MWSIAIGIVGAIALIFAGVALYIWFWLRQLDKLEEREKSNE